MVTANNIIYCIECIFPKQIIDEKKEIEMYMHIVVINYNNIILNLSSGNLLFDKKELPKFGDSPHDKYIIKLDCFYY